MSCKHEFENTQKIEKSEGQIDIKDLEININDLQKSQVSKRSHISRILRRNSQKNKEMINNFMTVTSSDID